MIIIYTPSGLLLGLAGVVLGGLAFLLSSLLSVGVFVLSLVWIAGGIGWKMVKINGENMRFPALFFIPLPFLGAPLLLLSVPLGAVEVWVRMQPVDVRSEKLDQLVNSAESKLTSGDTELAKELREYFLAGIQSPQAKSMNYGVHLSIQENDVLVIVFMEDLKKYKEPARIEIADAISKWLEQEPKTQGKNHYIALRGKVAFGLIKTPDGKIDEGVFASESGLYPFFGAQEFKDPK